MPTFHLHLQGRVQGVGFRPYVFGLARQCHITGTISNGKEGVHIYWNAHNFEDAKVFKNKILANPPVRSIIQTASLTECESKSFQDFNILKEDLTQKKATVDLSPDFAMCDACREEFYDPGNRRYHYPFITCTDCGPRFSIQNHVPYEREFTSMAAFRMCQLCQDEYNDPNDRRFYSQTNSCKDCGVKISLYLSSNTAEKLSDQAILVKALGLLSEGKTIAVKGIGGYLLLCCATNQRAIETIRKRKHRPEKPMAVLFKDIETAKEYTTLNQQAIELLTSSVSPIVVVPFKANIKSQLAFSEVTKDLEDLGVMLPYAPLLELIACQYGKPLIATSANLSGDALIYHEQQLPLLFNFADAVISHNREILNPQDDSVVKTSTSHELSVILRRARGMAPAFYNATGDGKNTILLSTGAMMKSSFALQYSNKIHISPYQGDTSSADALEKFEMALQRSLKTTGLEPDVIIADKHPEYPTSQFAKNLALEKKIPFKLIQHHKAHFAAVLGENHLLDSQKPILGVIWDGTGYGDDGQIWGSEFFSFDRGKVEWLCAFQPFSHIAGDLLAKQPRIAALSSTFGNEALFHHASKAFSNEELQIYKTLIKNSKFLNRGCGRFFDSAASLLDIKHSQSFEGQAAMLLEQCARRGSPSEFKLAYNGESFIDLHPLYEQILAVKKQRSNQDAARLFHTGLTKIIKQVASYYHFENIAFSGGVFQNTLLMEDAKLELENFFHIFTHRQLSPNDESISYGQLVAYQHFND